LQTGLGGLELLIPTPNYLDAQRTGNHVEANRAYALNPAASSPAHLRQYEFLGILIGCALRTHVLMPFNLPNTVWRFLVGLPLRRVDLLQVDKRVYDTLNSIATCAHAQAFDELIHHTLALDRPLVEEEDHKNSNKHSNSNNSNDNDNDNDNGDNNSNTLLLQRPHDQWENAWQRCTDVDALSGRESFQFFIFLPILLASTTYIYD
jgi:hypothetical protein